MRRLLLLRPEPGLSASAERAEALGLEVVRCPLFDVEAVAWETPDPTGYDALLLTSANAVRFAGAQLQELKSLPVHAVGQATAAAALAAGLRVDVIGEGNAADLLAALPCELRLLHLAGEDHRHAGHRAIDRRIIYRSVAIEDPRLPRMEGLVAAVHSPRAGRRLAELVAERSSTAIAAISQEAATASGSGWEAVEAAAGPNDKSLLALAARLCHTSSPQ